MRITGKHFLSNIKLALSPKLNEVNTININSTVSAQGHTVNDTDFALKSVQVSNTFL